METEIEYSLSEIFSILITRIWIIVLCVILGTTGTFLVTKYVIQEEYTASVSMYVAPNSGSVNLLASLSELNYAQEVVNTYIEILKTDVFLNSVSKTSGYKYTANQLNEMISMEAVNNTEIFKVQVTTNDPRQSLIIANSISLLAPGKIIEIKDADAVRVVDPASLPIEPSSPNILMNTAIGLILGLMLGVMLAFILSILDKRIKGEEDIVNHYDVPILGMVPTIKQI